MKVVYSPQAVADFRSISAYLRPRSPQGAKRVRTAILSTITQLETFPRLGTPQTTPSVYKMVTRRYSYLIYYTVDAEADALYIITIRHPSQQREFEDA